LNEITETIDTTTCSTVESIKNFQFRRKATLDLEDCLKEFEKKIIHHFTDPEQIEWLDENIMIVLRTGPKMAPSS
jgi:hypothetical protein